MDAIERAIRGALGNGDADDRAFREKVYRSVFAALERNIAATPQLTPEAAQRRRAALQTRITEIEQEFIPAIEPQRPPGAPAVDPAPARTAPPVEMTTPSDVRREPTFAPSVDATGPAAMSSPEVDMAIDGRDPAPDGPDAHSRAPRDRRPRRSTAIFVVVTLLATLAVLGWIAFELGLLGAPGATNAGTSRPQAGGSHEAGQPGPALGPGTADASREWATVFSPEDPTSVVAPSGAQAEIMDEEGTAFIRVRSGRGGDAVLFDVGQGILERLAGHRAVFDVVARAPDDKETQISIDCNFGELGDCGRRRYMVGPGRADYLFDIELPDVRPGAAGAIAITSDVDNGGKSIDIYEIKVSLSD